MFTISLPQSTEMMRRRGWSSSSSRVVVCGCWRRLSCCRSSRERENSAVSEPEKKAEARSSNSCRAMRRAISGWASTAASNAVKATSSSHQPVNRSDGVTGSLAGRDLVMSVGSFFGSKSGGSAAASQACGHSLCPGRGEQRAGRAARPSLIHEDPSLVFAARAAFLRQGELTPRRGIHSGTRCATL